MQQLSQKICRLSLFWLLLSRFSAAAQTTATPTADDYIRPYAEPFQFGSNIGYYGSGWNDESLAGIAQQTGVHSLRPTLPESFLVQHGYGVRRGTFNKYTNELGMKELTCFIEKPSEAHRDKTVYVGNTESSKLFAHLYEPIWNADGTVNPNNYYANYVYKLLLNYGSQVRFWEVVNEPDFANGASAAAWLTRAPTPAEQVNTRAPFYHYIRTLRITYEVVKKYRPDAYVTTSVGYPEYVDALLRYTDNPEAGAKSAEYPRTAGAYFDVLSFHCYPNYSLHYWDNKANGFRYRRTSDYAAAKVMEAKNQMAAVLAKYGYDGTQHPAKIFTITESNVSRRTSGSRIGSDAAQRNFGIKSLVLAQKNGIQQFYYYCLGENVDAPTADQTVTGSVELGLMGLYENLNRATPSTTKSTQLGQAFKTTSQLLYNYRYDAARTAALALPANVEGAAFGKDSSYLYVLWAKALTDKSEEATASYSFPAAWRVDSVRRREWNYAATGASATQAADPIALTGVPAFFTTKAGPGAESEAKSPAACAATGSLLREQWNNVPGSTVASIPLTLVPSSTSALSQFETIGGQEYNYGVRLRGYVCPPLSGAYTFFIAGDDDSELWLSSSDSVAGRVRIATCANWTASARDYTRYASQQSAPINLVAGKRYYIEAQQKQIWGPGYVSVSWRLPDGSSEAPIAGSRLAPFVEPLRPAVITATTAGAGPATRLTAYPNPFSQRATVEFRLGAAGAATLGLYDVRGQLVRQLYRGRGPAGTGPRIDLSAQGLPQGLYVLRLVTDQQVLTHKLLLTH